MRKSKKGTVSIALYVDDNLMIVDQVMIDKASSQLKKNGLVLKIKKNLTNDLYSNIFNKKKNKA